MKKNFRLLCSIFVLFVLLAPLHAQTEENELFNKIRLTDRVLIIKFGEDQVTAVSTEKGIVIIDSGVSPSLTAKYRSIIEKEFGRSDFKYVINTYHHRDRVNGNQVFKEAEIIAHENVINGMKETHKTVTKDYLKRMRERIKWRNQAEETLEKESSLRKMLKEMSYVIQKLCNDYETIYQLTLPTITFTDNLTLDMGDMKIELA